MALPKKKKKKSKIIKPFTSPISWTIKKERRLGTWVLERLNFFYKIYFKSRRGYTSYIELLKAKKGAHYSTLHLTEPTELPTKVKGSTKLEKRSIISKRKLLKRKKIQYSRFPLHTINKDMSYLRDKKLEQALNFKKYQQVRLYLNHQSRLRGKEIDSYKKKAKNKADYILNKGSGGGSCNLYKFL